MLRKTLMGLAVVLALAAPSLVQAAGPNPKHVAADAKWYLHLDLEALRTTELYKLVRAEVEKQFNLEEALAAIKQAAGVDPLNDIQGVTLYNTTHEQNVGGAIFYANIDQELLLKALSQNPTYGQQKYGEYTVHTWQDKGKTPAGVFYKEGVVVVGDKIETLKVLIDVLDGKKAGGSELVKERPGTFMLGAAKGLAELADRPNAKFLANAESMELAMSEKAGKLAGSLAMTMVSAERAAQVKNMAEGVKSWVAFNPDAPKEVIDMVGKITLSVDGARVVAAFEQNSADFLKQLKNLDDRMHIFSPGDAGKGGAPEPQ